VVTGLAETLTTGITIPGGKGGRCGPVAATPRRNTSHAHRSADHPSPRRADDIGPLHQSMLDLEARGPWYPLPATPLAKFEAAFAESGFWSRHDGIFAIVEHSERLIGVVGWGLLNGDIPDVAVSYRLLDRADHGKGIATEASGLLVGWLFDTGQMNRLRIDAHVDNEASRRVAEKSGFTPEAIARASWYDRGRWHDIAVYTITREEFIERRPAPA
jgi:ribosomal-protein-alanine N-acetyltransferase